MIELFTITMLIAVIIFVVLLIKIFIVESKKNPIYYNDNDGNTFYTYENYLYLKRKSKIYHIIIDNETDTPIILSENELLNYIKVN